MEHPEQNRRKIQLYLTSTLGTMIHVLGFDPDAIREEMEDLVANKMVWEQMARIIELATQNAETSAEQLRQEVVGTKPS